MPAGATATQEAPGREVPLSLREALGAVAPLIDAVVGEEPSPAGIEVLSVVNSINNNNKSVNDNNNDLNNYHDNDLAQKTIHTYFSDTMNHKSYVSKTYNFPRFEKNVPEVVHARFKKYCKCVPNNCNCADPQRL